MRATRASFGLAVLAAPVLTALLVLGLVASRGAGPIAAAALVLAACASPLLAWRTLATGDRRLLLAAQAVALFQAGLVLGSAPAILDAPHRLLRLAIVLTALAGASSLTLALLRPARLRAALAVGLGIPLALFLADLVVPYPAVGPAPSRPEWRTMLVRDTIAGPRFTPGATFITTYPDSGAGEHDLRDFRERTWLLLAFPGNAASLVLPPTVRREVDVQITQADTGPAWHIQLNQAGLSVRQLRGYSVTLQIRADSERTVSVGFLQAHAPWEIIGFYRTLTVDTAWTEVNEYFIAGVDDDDTRLAFDIGGSAVPVTIRDVHIEDEFGKPVTPPLPLDQYEVRYAFDEDGCRRTRPRSGAEAPPALLVLGDGDALGLGVREDDIFSSRMAVDPEGQRAGAIIRNCAAPGMDASTAKARYRELAGATPPRTVLYVLGPETADRLARQATAAGMRRLPAPMRLSGLLARSARAGAAQWHAAAVPFAAGLRELAAAVESDGGRLAIVYFRADANPDWTILRSVVDSTLARTAARTIDLGPDLADRLSGGGLLNEEPGRHPNALAHRLAAAALRADISITTPPGTPP